MRALAQDPAQRYQSMAQMEYDLVKSLFGRTRAVADLLGLHQAETRVESSPHDIDDPPSQPTLPQEESLGDGVLSNAWRRAGLGRPHGIRRRAARSAGARARGDGDDTGDDAAADAPAGHHRGRRRHTRGQFRVPVSAPRAQFRSPPEGLPPLCAAQR